MVILTQETSKIAEVTEVTFYIEYINLRSLITDSNYLIELDSLKFENDAAKFSFAKLIQAEKAPKALFIRNNCYFFQTLKYYLIQNH